MNAENRYWASAIPPEDKALFAMNLNLAALEEAGDDSFSFDALMIHAWLSQLLDEGIETYVSRRTAKSVRMQTGQAHRSFLSIFGHTQDADFHRLAQNMYRFTTCDDPLAPILFRALQALSAEHETVGDFASLRRVESTDQPQEAARWMRESMDRWFEWVDAFVHIQTHAQWHLAPECFDPNPDKRAAALQALKKRRMEQFFACRRSNWQTPDSDSTRFYRELPIWQVLPQAEISEPQRPWPHPELDEAIISLWPLVARHHWTFGDLLTVLQDLLLENEAFPCQGERNLATYCLNSLHLRKIVHGKTAKRERPTGYLVALRLIPPLPPRPTFSFGTPPVEEDEPDEPEETES